MRAITGSALVLAVAAALVSVPFVGCQARGLQKIEVPAGGVRLAYDFSPGQTYAGHIRVGNTRQVEGMSGSLNQSIECDVEMVVIGDDESRGGTLMSARFSNVDVEWALPPNVPFSADEFLKLAQQQVQGMEVRFTVVETGKIVFMPPPPQDAPDELKVVINNVTDALESAFLIVPKKSLAQGESWKEDEKKGRKGKLGRYREGTIQSEFTGLFRDKERGEDVAKLVIKHTRKEVITTKDGRRQNEREGKTTALFSTSGKYLAEIDAETRDFDPTQGTTFRKVRAQWQKGGKSDGAAVAGPAGGEVQQIGDPCNPDYVGPEVCPSETQQIDDPCNPDYVGPDECKADTKSDTKSDAKVDEKKSDAKVPDKEEEKKEEKKEAKTEAKDDKKLSLRAAPKSAADAT